MENVTEGSEVPSGKVSCRVCGAEATRQIFSPKGVWRLCDKPECWAKLAGAFDDDGVTWMTKALPKRDAKSRPA